ncbi:Flavin monooxygenase-like [Dillenia turbinata]|uniref:Flavin-containing monooxygenase n=1 Tax=Dillenia turbinata TaxID=194707 RepID=A0AAN8W2Y7_9MAGN
METQAIIVGAGPAGMATSACLNLSSIPNVVLEREGCCASLWKKHTYDRLKLHLAKEYCALPHMPFPPHFPTFVPKTGFIEYLDAYASKFSLQPRFERTVQSASYDVSTKKWQVKAFGAISNKEELYYGRYLIVATGENSHGYIPSVAGLETFTGEYMHSSMYSSGSLYNGKNVLVVGCGNSGMEIAFDLSCYEAKASIVARSPVHVVTKQIVRIGMFLLRFLPLSTVDPIVLLLSKLKFGDTAKYGLPRPHQGPFVLKALTGRSPTIDVGAMEKIRAGEIQVLPAISNIKGNMVEFENGKVDSFDVIIFATGYRSTVKNWLRDGNDLFDENGVPKQRFPNHWKGKNGLYCAGFSSKGLAGVSDDALKITNDIHLVSHPG